MATVELAPGVYWVGVVDWSNRDFHGYVTRHGTTYNAYLIRSDKVTLVDTVKAIFSRELLAKVEEIITPERIDFVVVNHVEPDHSGALPSVMERAGNAKIIATEAGVNGLVRYYHREDWPFTVVKTGHELSLGGKTLSFIEAPMLHWPDSMFTYVKEDAVLLPNDAFGQHLATSQRFDDEVEGVMPAAAEYYANILMPFSTQVSRMVERIKGMGLPLRVIAPSHGVIWRSDPTRIIQAYADWSRGVSINKAVVVFDSMWGSTERMAHAVAEGLASRGVEVKVLHLRRNDINDVIKEVLDAKAIIIGASTLNNGPLQSVSSLLAYMRGLRPRGKRMAVFGSYGWGGGAIRAVEAECKAMGMESIAEALTVKYMPDQKELQSCVEYGCAIAEKIKS